MLELLLYGYIGDRYDRCDATTVRNFINDNPGTDPILVRISSPGGVVTDGLATYEALAEASLGVAIPFMDPKPAREVHVMIDGLAASMATVIAMVGKTISIADTGRFMIHNPSGAVIFGNATDLRAEADRLDHMRDQALGIYVGRSGNDAATVTAMMDKETWFTAQEAVDAGFCTDVVQVTVTADDNQETMAANLKPSVFERLKAKAIDLTKAAAKLEFRVPKDFAGISVAACMVVTAPPALADPVIPPVVAPTPTPAPTPAPAPTPTPVPAQETMTMDPLNLDGTIATTAEQIAAWATFTSEQKATATAAARTLARTARQRDNQTIRQIGSRMAASGITEAHINEQIDAMASVEAAATAFATMAAEQERTQEDNRGGPRITVTNDRTMADVERAGQDFVTGLARMAANRMRPISDQLEITPAQMELANEPVWRIAARCLAAGGVSVAGKSEEQIVFQAVRMQGMHTQADFGLHLTLGLNASAVEGYNLADNTNIEQWTGTEYVDDFNEVNFTSWGAFSGLRDIPEGGDFEQGTITEAGSVGQLRKRGRDFTLSLEASENRRLAGLADIAAKMGQRARFDEQKVAETCLIQGIYKQAGTGQRRNIYSVDAKTQLPADMAFGVPAFDAATTLMATQQDPNHAKLWEDADEGISSVDQLADKDYLPLSPRVVGVSAESIPMGNVMNRAFTFKDANGSEYPNPYAGTFTLVPLYFIDSRDYYFLDRPGMNPVVVMIRQRGKVGASVYQIDVPNKLSMRWGVLNRIGAMIGTERGIVKGRRPA